jgi:hypothetical protein
MAKEDQRRTTSSHSDSTGLKERVQESSRGREFKREELHNRDQQSFRVCIARKHKQTNLFVPLGGSLNFEVEANATALERGFDAKTGKAFDQIALLVLLLVERE